TCGSNVSSISVSFGDDAGEGDTQLLVDCGEEVQVIAGALMPGALIPPPDTRILPGCLEAKVNDSRPGVVASALTSGAVSGRPLASSPASQPPGSNSGAGGLLSQTTSGSSSSPIESPSSSAAADPSADAGLTETSPDASSTSEEPPSGPSVGPSSGGGPFGNQHLFPEELWEGMITRGGFELAHSSETLCLPVPQPAQV
ncbi:hypothetical protein KC316_g663, partial [Hortaea werneckii]